MGGSLDDHDDLVLAGGAAREWFGALVGLDCAACLRGADAERVPAGRGIQITALNFGQEVIAEELQLTGFTPGPVVDMINETVEGDLTEDGRLMVNLDPYEAMCLRIVNSSGHV